MVNVQIISIWEPSWKFVWILVLSFNSTAKMSSACEPRYGWTKIKHCGRTIKISGLSDALHNAMRRSFWSFCLHLPLLMLNPTNCWKAGKVFCSFWPKSATDIRTRNHESMTKQKNLFLSERQKARLGFSKSWPYLILCKSTIRPNACAPLHCMPLIRVELTLGLDFKIHLKFFGRFEFEDSIRAGVANLFFACFFFLITMEKDFIFYQRRGNHVWIRLA